MKTQGEGQIEAWSSYLEFYEGRARAQAKLLENAQSVAERKRALCELGKTQNAVRVAELQLAQLVSQKLGV